MTYHQFRYPHEPEPHGSFETFQLTAREVAESDGDLVWGYLLQPEFQMAGDGKIREQMFETMIRELEIQGGWFWQSCFPGCLPDGPPIGPFASEADAIADANT